MPQIRAGAEVGEHTCTIEPLPPERVVRQAVVLIPAQLDGKEVVEPSLLDELRQVPGITKDVGQPEHGRHGMRAKVLAKERYA
jgi:hypothetical protein